MSGLDNLKTRINYRGGSSQEARMQADKVRSVKKASLYSYQSETIEIDGKRFKCLINKDKLNANFDDKIISIPHYTIDLNAAVVGKTSEGEVETGLKQGDVFHWLETDTYWLVYLQYIEETAYFRADIRKCQHELDINGRKYKVCARGPIETKLDWKQKDGTYYNTLNYTQIMYVPANKETLDYFKRFTKIKLDGDTWEVQAVDRLSTQGIIEVAIKESFNNPLEDELLEQEEKIENNGNQEAGLPHISGPIECYPYDTLTYKVEGISNGTWSVDKEKIIKINSQNESTVSISIVTGRSNNFVLKYNSSTQTLELPVTILSL